MTITEAAPVVLPDGRELAAGTVVRIKGERGAYRVHHLNDTQRGVWLYGGTGHGEYRCRQWRCVPLERVGAVVKARKGEHDVAI